MTEPFDYIDLIANVALSGTRMAVALYTIPFIHQGTLVPMVRNAIILSFTVPVLPVVLSYRLVRQEAALFILVLVAKEALLGFIIGFLIGIVFWAMQNAGNVIDMQRGAFFATMADPLSKNETTPLGNLLFHMSTILFFICGGFRETIGALLDSYRVWPIHRCFPHIDQNLVDFAANQLVRCMNLVVIFAAPIVISSLTADLALGMLNRFVPQMNAFMISMPVKSTIVSFILILYIWFLLKCVQGHFLDAGEILRIVGGAVQ